MRDLSHVRPRGRKTRSFKRDLRVSIWPSDRRTKEIKAHIGISSDEAPMAFEANKLQVRRLISIGIIFLSSGNGELLLSLLVLFILGSDLVVNR